MSVATTASPPAPVAPAAQNRVAPTGEIVAAPLRCAWMGNRGVLHDDRSARCREVVRGWRGTAWITCTLADRGYDVRQWAPGRYTPLFLHDEAVALAAGHRPCFQCRHADATAFRDAVDPGLRARDLDRRLHRERSAGPHRAGWASLPSGAFVLHDTGDATEAVLVTDGALVPWTTAGYGEPVGRPRRGRATVLTPASSLVALRSGYRAQVGWPTAR